MDNALPTHPYLTHPLTGCPLQAVGVVNGRTVWPILGGDGTGDGGAGGGAGGAGDGDGGAGNAGGDWTPPASQEEFNRIIGDRLARERAKYADYDTLKEQAGRFQALELELSSDMEKATHRASEDGYQAAMALMVPRLIQGEFRAAAQGVLSDEQLTALLEDLDLTKYADDDGEPDVEKIRAKVAKFAPAPNGHSGTRYVAPPISLGQGKQPPAATKPGDQGRAQAAKRFKKQ